MGRLQQLVGGAHTRAGKIPRSDYLRQVNFALGQMKMEGWCSGELAKSASIVLVVIISSQKQIQNGKLQDEQNNQLKAWINLKCILCTHSFSNQYSGGCVQQKSGTTNKACGKCKIVMKNTTNFCTRLETPI